MREAGGKTGVVDEWEGWILNYHRNTFNLRTTTRAGHHTPPPQESKQHTRQRTHPAIPTPTHSLFTHTHNPASIAECLPTLMHTLFTQHTQPLPASQCPACSTLCPGHSPVTRAMGCSLSCSSRDARGSKDVSSSSFTKQRSLREEAGSSGPVRTYAAVHTWTHSGRRGNELLR